MNKKDIFLMGFIVGFFSIFIIFIAYLSITKPEKQGQIDALTGKIKYELITHPDSTKTWKRIPNGK